MATTPTAAPVSPSIHSTDLASIPSRKPLPLTASQEAQVRDIYYKRVRSKCAPEIKEFATCAVGRTISSTWACRQQRLAMTDCMVRHATRDEEDKAREEWFTEIPLRAKENEERTRKIEEEKKKHHEWWGLDENGRRKWNKDGEGQ